MQATHAHSTHGTSPSAAIPVSCRVGRSDAQLARRVGAGDSLAFALLDARHRGRLIRYAGALMRRSEHDAEDIVQDVLVRAHAVLRTGSVPADLLPWLYRLTRNRAFDEMRRKRWADTQLEPCRHGDGERQDPERRLLGSESMSQLVEDILALAPRQRQALLARELEGDSLEAVAARLGVSVAAAQKLTMRARENLVRARAARDADCDDIRTALLDAHERGVRPTEHALRHVRGCDACRASRSSRAHPARRMPAEAVVALLPAPQPSAPPLATAA